MGTNEPPDITFAREINLRRSGDNHPTAASRVEYGGIRIGGLHTPYCTALQAFPVIGFCQRMTSISSPLMAQRGPIGSAASNSPATHQWSAGSHLTPSRYGDTSRGKTPSTARR